MSNVNISNIGTPKFAVLLAAIMREIESPDVSCIVSSVRHLPLPTPSMPCYAYLRYSMQFQAELCPDQAPPGVYSRPQRATLLFVSHGPTFTRGRRTANAALKLSVLANFFRCRFPIQITRFVLDVKSIAFCRRSVGVKSIAFCPCRTGESPVGRSVDRCWAARHRPIVVPGSHHMLQITFCTVRLSLRAECRRASLADRLYSSTVYRDTACKGRTLALSCRLAALSAAPFLPSDTYYHRRRTRTCAVCSPCGCLPRRGSPCIARLW